MLAFYGFRPRVGAYGCGASRHTKQEPHELGVACLVTIPPHVRHHRLFPDLPSKPTPSLDITYNHAFPKRILQPPIWEAD